MAAKVIVCDEVESKTTVPVPAAQFGDVLLFVHDPPNVHVALPILRYAAALEMDVFPAMVTTDGAPDPSRTADPERVNPPVAVSPDPADAPIVSVPAAWVIAPLTTKSNTPMTTVPAHPVVLKEDIAAFRSTVTIPPPEFASKNTGLEAFGIEHPFTPPEEEDQCVVWDQLPVPPIQVGNTVIVVRFVASLFVTEKLPTLIAPSAMLPDPISVRPLNVMLWPVFVRTAPLFTVRMPAVVTGDVMEIVPPITRL